MSQDLNENKGASQRPDAIMTGRLIVGGVLVLLGGIFLLQNVYHFNIMAQAWPLILIVVGIAILFGRKR